MGRIARPRTTPAGTSPRPWAIRSVAGPRDECSQGHSLAPPGRETRTTVAARDAAARIAWSFRTLFNLPEATALIRGERPKGDTTPYWRQVVDYCAAGNLQGRAGRVCSYSARS